ncbi:hypothetical protein PCE1_002406 [Barthelona sp. PCE]
MSGLVTTVSGLRDALFDENGQISRDQLVHDFIILASDFFGDSVSEGHISYISALLNMPYAVEKQQNVLFFLEFFRFIITPRIPLQINFTNQQAQRGRPSMNLKMEFSRLRCSAIECFSLLHSVTKKSNALKHILKRDEVPGFRGGTLPRDITQLYSTIKHKRVGNVLRYRDLVNFEKQAFKHSAAIERGKELLDSASTGKLNAVKRRLYLVISQLS